MYAFLAKENLKKVIYRCDRYDIDFNNFNNLELKDENYIENLTCINSQNFWLHNIKENKNFFVYPSISSLINNAKNTKSFYILNLLIILSHKYKKKLSQKNTLYKPSFRNKIKYIIL